MTVRLSSFALPGHASRPGPVLRKGGPRSQSQSRFRGAVWAAVLALTAGLPAHAAGSDPAAGKRAATLCFDCHAIEPGTASLLEEAPPFDLIAERWDRETLEQALIDGFVTRHQKLRMPVYNLYPEEARDLAAYIMSLEDDGAEPRSWPYPSPGLPPSKY